MKKGSITPGERLITVISAMPGGTAEKIIRAMTVDLNGRQDRKFGAWEENNCVGTLLMKNNTHLMWC